MKGDRNTSSLTLRLLALAIVPLTVSLRARFRSQRVDLLLHLPKHPRNLIDLDHDRGLRPELGIGELGSELSGRRKAAEDARGQLQARVLMRSAKGRSNEPL
jgi:hypothetical protein